MCASPQRSESRGWGSLSVLDTLGTLNVPGIGDILQLAMNVPTGTAVALPQKNSPQHDVGLQT